MSILKNKDIFERIPGYSNKMMYEQCMILYRVMFKTDEVKVGHGKKAIIKKVYRYTGASDDSARKMIKKSMEYYKDLWNSETIKKPL